MFGRFSQFSFGQRRGMMSPSPILSMQSAPFRYVQRVLTNAELLTLNATPITLFPAQPGVIYVPLLWGIRSIKPAGAWTTSPTLSIITEGITSPALTAANIPAALNTAGAIDSGLLLDDVQTTTLTTVSNRVNKALQVRSTVVPNQGAGANATVQVFVAFVLWRTGTGT